MEPWQEPQVSLPGSPRRKAPAKRIERSTNGEITADDHAAASMLHQSRTYIQDFAAAYETADYADELIAAMTAKNPHDGNLWTLQVSSQAAVRRRDRARNAGAQVG